MVDLKRLVPVGVAGPTVLPEKARFTKIQNGKKPDKHLLLLTKTRALLRLHR